MLEKKDKSLEPQIAGPVLVAIMILALSILLIWMAK